jgi:4'-phosphopantetheinyl transferase
MNAPQLLPLDEVRVWYRFTTAIADEEVDALSALLSDDERARARRFVFARDRRDYTAAHALLRRTLSLYADVRPTGWIFEAADGQKPVIAAPPTALTFNLSHTHGLVACAVARGTSIGVDVESIDRLSSGREIAERFFSPFECRGLDAREPSDYTPRFIELWTLKESYLKGIGKGLSHPLDNFSFDLDRPPGITFGAPPDVNTADWQFTLAAPAPSYRLAVAVKRTIVTARYRIVLRDADAADAGDAATMLGESPG